MYVTEALPEAVVAPMGWHLIFESFGDGAASELSVPSFIKVSREVLHLPAAVLSDPELLKCCLIPKYHRKGCLSLCPEIGTLTSDRSTI